MAKETSTPARNTKVMNRFDVTSRLVARLKNEEAVVGGIGNTNFDPLGRRPSPAEFYMLGQHGPRLPDRARRRFGAAEARTFALEGDGSLLMQMGCLSTIAAQAPRTSP